MILLTVGTQFPFDRLVRVVDEWALEQGRTDVIAQIGPSQYTPKALKTFDFIDPSVFRSYQEQASVHIAHAGMGSILTAMEIGKPIVIMPRDHLRGEHRNAHQLATARRFCDKLGVHVAFEESELRGLLTQVDQLIAGAGSTSKAPPEFVGRLRAHIDGQAVPDNFFKRLLSRRQP
jgi:UDP-N-acetylglucosamine transferase subunit ALG13